MIQLIGFVVALMLLLIGGGNQPGPTPPPPPPPSESWTQWIKDYGGPITPLSNDLFPSIEAEGSYHIVRAANLDGARTFAADVVTRTAAVKDTEGPATIVITLDVPGGRSAFRFLAGETPDEVWDLVGEPLPGPASLRMVGFRDPSVTDSHHQPPATGFTKFVFYFGGDVVDIAEKAQSLPGYQVMIYANAYPGFRNGDVLGDVTYDKNSPLAEVQAKAAAIRQARQAGFATTSITNNYAWFADRDDALAVAELLPADTPIGIGGGSEQRRMIIHPEAKFDYGSPTRAELIAYFRANPAAQGGASLDSVKIDFWSAADCERFLAAPPAWSSRVTFQCETSSEASFQVDGTLSEITAVAAKARAAAEQGKGRVSIFGQRSILVGTTVEAGGLEAVYAKVREIGWEGSRKIMLTDKASGDRGASIELASTETGVATVESTRPNGLNPAEQRMVDAWNATATG